jgi:hypothetical protein
VIGDFARMKVDGSIGMALICYYNNRSLKYTPAVVDKATDQVIWSAEPIKLQ